MDIVGRSGHLFSIQKKLTLLSKAIFRKKDTVLKKINWKILGPLSFQKSPHVFCNYFELEYCTRS